MKFRFPEIVATEKQPNSKKFVFAQAQNIYHVLKLYFV